MVKFILAKDFFYLALVPHSSIHLNNDKQLKPLIYHLNNMVQI